MSRRRARFIRTRNATRDEAAPNQALQQKGTAGSLLLKTRAAVYWNQVNPEGQQGYQGSNTIQVLSGTLRNYIHDFGEDSVSGLIVGDAWLLSKVTLIGRITWDPISNKCWYDTNSPLIFNEGGWPSCGDHPLYGPVFIQLLGHFYDTRQDKINV